MEQTAISFQACELICGADHCEGGRPTTFYVHMDGGDIETVGGVTSTEVTEKDIVFHRGTLAPVLYPRSKVYFTCCTPHQAPPQF